MLNLLGILKERFEVEKVELEVVACLSGGNLASLELGVATIKYLKWEEWGRGYGKEKMGKRQWGKAESIKLRNFKMGILKKRMYCFDMPQMVRSLNITYSLSQASFLSLFHSLLVHTVYVLLHFEIL